LRLADVAGTVHDVAVDDAKIEVAVVVVVEEDRAEADVRQRRSADSARKRHVLEQPLAEISKERMRFELVIRHDEIQVAVTVVVAEVGAHACPRHPSLATETPDARATSAKPRLRSL
jgi:hypothetical protein